MEVPSFIVKSVCCTNRSHRSTTSSMQVFTDDVNNPLVGEYGVDELLEAFSEMVCSSITG